MTLMWPDCVRNALFRLSFINFESSIVYDRFPKSQKMLYDDVSSDYTRYGYESHLFLYNALDTLIIAGAFIALIPAFFLVAKISKK